MPDLPAGSPPRAWGRFTMPHNPVNRNRFTPTCVGTMMEKTGPEYPTTGSPPRAWGRCLPEAPLGLSARFTPTCVGTILPHTVGHFQTTVHPHVRGDDGVATSSEPTKNGSPPRAWGRSLYSRRCPSAAGSPPRAWGRCSPGVPLPADLDRLLRFSRQRGLRRKIRTHFGKKGFPLLGIGGGSISLV